MSIALRFLAKIILAVVMLFSASTGWAGERLIADFYGEYYGRVQADDSNHKYDRDLSVLIRPAKYSQYFRIKWTTVIHKANNKTKRKIYDIKFTTTDRPNVYASAMKTNVFGGSEPLDPLKGDPFVWARIVGDTLTVHALLIKDDGGFEMQIYDRTLNEEGLLLEYTRKVSGEPVTRITTQLIRVID